MCLSRYFCGCEVQKKEKVIVNLRTYILETCEPAKQSVCILSDVDVIMMMYNNV